jgi:hypothetical protein
MQGELPDRLMPQRKAGGPASAPQGHVLGISVYGDVNSAGNVVLRIEEASRVAIRAGSAQASRLVDAA